jgi:hypothetical protein
VGPRETAPFAISAQSDNNIEPAIPKIERVRVTLRAKADYAANLSAQRVQSDLSIAINAHRHRPKEWPIQAAAPN